MASDASLIIELGVVNLSDEAWAKARHRTEIIGLLAKPKPTSKRQHSRFWAMASLHQDPR
jgi:hypothetical protein